MRESDASTGAPTLRYAQPPDLGPSCRPVPRVNLLNTRDERVGEFDGVLLSAMSDNPRYLVLQRGGSAGCTAIHMSRLAESVKVKEGR